jgi:hypothetical protein
MDTSHQKSKTDATIQTGPYLEVGGATIIRY